MVVGVGLLLLYGCLFCCCLRGFTVCGGSSLGGGLLLFGLLVECGVWFAIMLIVLFYAVCLLCYACFNYYCYFIAAWCGGLYCACGMGYCDCASFWVCGLIATWFDLFVVSMVALRFVLRLGFGCLGLLGCCRMLRLVGLL